MNDESREFVSRSLALLSDLADITLLNFPRDHTKRSLDLTLKSRSYGTILLKLAYDVSSVGKSEREELKEMSSTLRINALIISERKDNVKLLEGVVYDYDGSKVINMETLVSSLAGDFPFVYEDKNGFKVRIDGLELRKRREQKGYSLGDLASLVKVSRKSVYEYERGTMSPSIEVAERIINELGEDVVKSVNIFDPDDAIMSEGAQERSQNIKFDDRNEEIVAQRLYELNYKTCHAKRAPLDLCFADGKTKAVLTIAHSTDRPRILNDKVDNMSRLARSIDGESYVIVPNPNDRRLMLENIINEPNDVFTIGEFLNYLGERFAKGSCNNR